jgi:hypothetical protein
MQIKDNQGVIPIIVIVGIVILAAVLVCLWLWPFITLGALIIAGALVSYIYLGMPKVTYALLIAGALILAYGIWWG